MVNASLEIRGLDELVRKLGDLDKITLALQAPMQSIGAKMQSVMKEYPPPKPTYRRTFALRDGWIYAVNVTSQSATVAVSNNVEYAPLVQSDDDQAWMHKGIWHTDKQTLDDNEQQFINVLQSAVDAEIRRIGL